LGLVRAITSLPKFGSPTSRPSRAASANVLTAPITTAALLASRAAVVIRMAAMLCTRNFWLQRASASNSRRSSCRLGMLSIDAGAAGPNHGGVGSAGPCRLNSI
jgi:hypothetical protein